MYVGTLLCPSDISTLQYMPFSRHPYPERLTENYMLRATAVAGPGIKLTTIWPFSCKPLMLTTRLPPPHPYQGLCASLREPCCVPLHGQTPVRMLHNAYDTDFIKKQR